MVVCLWVGIACDLRGEEGGEVSRGDVGDDRVIPGAGLLLPPHERDVERLDSYAQAARIVLVHCQDVLEQFGDVRVASVELLRGGDCIE